MEHTPRTITEIRLKTPTAPQPPPRVADVIVDELVHAGVDTLFMLPGGTISPVLDACLDKPQIRQVGTRHESGAMFAAAGYARATEQLGVVCVTSGPGVLNTLTGLANAHCEGIPLLVLAGEVPRAKQGQMALQDGSAHHLDVLSMVKPVVKLALEITRPEAAPAIVRRAIRTAMSGKRGPVVLTVPMDVARCVVPQQRFFSEVALDYAIDGGMMGRALDEAAASLEAAVRPAILAGSGVRHGLGPERLLHLAERLQIPVMTTPKAKGLFPESHPLSLGVFGHGGHPSSQEHLERGIDVLLAVGTSMGDTGTDGQSHLLRPSETLIHVDVDALQLGRHYPVTLGIVGEADTVLRALARRVSPVDERRHFGVQRHSDAKLDAIGPDGTITPQRALWELQQVLPPDTLYTCDIGEHLLFATHYLQIDSPGGFMAMNGLASMGSGLGAAIGVQLGCPGRTVAAICGDGTFAMHGAEVATASAEGLPIVFVVLDDGRFGMVENGHEALYGRTPGFSTEPVNVRALAEALGARTTVIRKPGEILNANLQSTRRPTVLDDSNRCIGSDAEERPVRRAAARGSGVIRVVGDDNPARVPSPVTVLYVDDERSNRIVFEHAFNKQFGLVTAASASEAMAVLESRSVGVLVTDQRMPEMSGNELLTAVKERWPEVVRIVITAYSDFDPLLRAVNEGLVARYIVKPWEREELLEVLRWACEVHQVGARDALIRERLLKTERLAMLGTVAGGAMHDMSQPLVALLNNSEVLVRYARSFPALGDLLRLHGQLLPSTERKNLREIIRDLPELATDLFDAAKAATAISRQFKGLFRHQHRHEAPEADPVRVVEHALAVTRSQLPRGARGRYVGPDLVPMVAVGPTDLFRVLANLVMNAAEAMSTSRQSGGSIEVDANVYDEAVEIAVRDDGRGMSPEVAAKATKEYFTTRSEGTGLGLSQCRRIVEGSAGTMTIDSVEGEGTTVTIRLPRAQRFTGPPAQRDAS